MPSQKKVWIDEDGDGLADSHGEIVDNDTLHADAGGDIVDEVVEEPVVTPKKVTRVTAKAKASAALAAKKKADADRRRRRHMGF